jgi:hypothetical protein
MALRENGILTVPDGLDCVSLTVGTTFVQPAALTFAAHNLKRTVIQSNQPIRWTASGSDDPTATFGLKLLAGDTLIYDGSITNLKFIRDAAASADATLIIHYFGLS